MRRTVLYSGFIGRLVVMTVSASLAIVILSATAFAQGNASQDQYTNEPPQSDPSTAPATDAPGPDSTAPASPNASQKSPTPDSTAPATDPPTSEPTTAPATETPAPDSTAPGTETPAPDSTAPSAPNASQECPWEPIQPGEIQGFSGCPWHRELPDGSQDLGNGQCYDTHLGVTYSCSGESQTPNPGGPGGQTPNPGHPGIQTPNPLDPGIQTPNPGHAGSSNSGGSNIIRQIRSFLGSILTGGNLQKQGPRDQQKYSSIRPMIRPIIGLLNPMNVGLITGVVELRNPIIGALQGDSPKIDKTGGLLTGIADVLRQIIGAGQGESAKPVISPDPPKGLINRLTTKEGRDAVSACLETGGPAAEVVGDIPVDQAIFFIKVVFPLYLDQRLDPPKGLANKALTNDEARQGLMDMLVTNADKHQLLTVFGTPPGAMDHPPISDLIKGADLLTDDDPSNDAAGQQHFTDYNNSFRNSFPGLHVLKGISILLTSEDSNDTDAALQEFTRFFDQKNRDRLLAQVGKDYTDNVGRCFTKSQ
jgi:hypothetical protein